MRRRRRRKNNKIVEKGKRKRLCLEDLDLRCCYFWPRLSEMSIKSTRDYLKAKNVVTTVIYAILDNGLRMM